MSETHSLQGILLQKRILKLDEPFYRAKLIKNAKYQPPQFESVQKANFRDY